MKRKLIASLLLSAGLTTSASFAADSMPSQADMWKIIQQQQKQIEELKSLVAETKAETQKQLKTTQDQVEATTLALEAFDQGMIGGSGWWANTSIGGYGELHYNNYDQSNDVIDFHRFVLFVNHEYTDRVRLFSELEIEHSYSGNGNPGAVELEQAFVQIDWSDKFSTDTGLFLMPIGILNETHEPDTFYGVERNNIENKLIPTTWWEAGIKGNYRMDNGVSLEGGIVSGLNTTNGNIRSGRQKVALATMNEPAVVGRIKYTGTPGLELAASAFYQDNLEQSTTTETSGLLSTAHAVYTKDGFGLRALYARWDLSGNIAAAAEEQQGFYVEPSYRFEIDEEYGDVGFFYRYSDYEFFNGSLNKDTIHTIGVNYWPIDKVVFKADLQDTSNADSLQTKGDTVINLGFGYHF